MLVLGLQWWWWSCLCKVHSVHSDQRLLWFSPRLSKHTCSAPRANSLWRQVVVKVQHKNIGQIMKQDLKNLMVIVSW